MNEDDDLAFPEFDHYEDDDDIPPLPSPVNFDFEAEDWDAPVESRGENRGPVNVEQEKPHQTTGSAAKPTRKRKNSPVLFGRYLVLVVSISAATRLLSEKGLSKLREDAKRLKFQGVEHEQADLKTVMNFYRAWIHDLFPKMQFRDAILRVEKICRERRCGVTLSAWREGDDVIE
ncbi:10056_t:CDS:2 [Paraglomus occultum]|uniref:Chromosome segregation in meiosis protein n=1 Tax=Paraglomus occultum TaxID=144539 RepID=A0A9N8ZDV8_9GLOM|nr:10056_t:CDS:2 [Paraglomus occultum]